MWRWEWSYEATSWVTDDGITFDFASILPHIEILPQRPVNLAPGDTLTLSVNNLAIEDAALLKLKFGGKMYEQA